MGPLDDGARAEFHRDQMADLRAEALEADYPDYDERVNGGDLVDPYTGQPINPEEF